MLGHFRPRLAAQENTVNRGLKHRYPLQDYVDTLFEAREAE